MAEPQAATLPSDAPAAAVQAPSDEQITQALRTMLDTTDLATTTGIRPLNQGTANSATLP